MNRKLVALLAGAAVLIGVQHSASAQGTFPSKRITIIVPAPPGGATATDPLGRAVAKYMEAQFKQPVIVDNKAGAGGYLGAEFVARSPADGYTLLFSVPSTLHSSLFTKDHREMTKELTPVKYVAAQPYAIIVSSSSGASNLREFAALAKANPGKFNHGLVTNVTYSLDMMKLFSLMGAKVVNVSYVSTAPSLTALMAGDVHILAAGPGSVRPAVEAGKGTVVAVSSSSRYSGLANVPTLKEQGYDIAFGANFGLFAPSATPQNVLDILYRETRAATISPEMRDLVQKLNIQIASDEPMAELKRQMLDERTLYSGMLKEMGQTPQ